MNHPILGWALAYGYPLMFVGMAVEGPLVTAAAAFAASLGHFDIRLVMLLAIAGDVVPDVCYYAIGYWSRNLEWVSRRFRIPAENLARIEAFVSRHQLKALAVFKYVPLIAVTGLILTGRTRMPFRKFLAADILIGIPNVLLFTGIGYFFGQAFVSIVSMIEDVRFAAGLVLTGGLALYVLYRWIARRVARDLTERVRREETDSEQ
jgi:membrane protein DedA with SNARE-associated domain